MTPNRQHNGVHGRQRARSRFGNLYDPIRADVFEKLTPAVRPDDFDTRNDLTRAQPKMNGPQGGRGVADATGLRVGLIRQTDLCPQTVAITPAAGQSKCNPMILVRRDITPEFRRLAQHGDDYIEAAIIIQIRNCKAPVSAGCSKLLSRRGRDVLELTVSKVPKQTVWQLVLVARKPADVVGDV